MSHISKIEVQITDLTALDKACKKLGLELSRGQKTYRWYGRSVGDYPLPEGFREDELGKCEHAIRIPNNPHAYEIGVVRSRGGKPGFSLLWDFFAGGYGMQAKVGEGAKKLVQEYTVQRAMMKVPQGFRIQRTNLQDGRVILRATR